jgi:hypothetical protein
VVYIIANVVVMTSLVIIMNVVMQRSNNLLNAIWIHLFNNVIFYHLTNITHVYFGWLTIIFAITGALFLLYHYGYLSRGRTIVQRKTNMTQYAYGVSLRANSIC